MFRSASTVLLAILTTFSLIACQKEQQASETETSAVMTAPTNDDNDAWKRYLSDVVKSYVPAGQSARLYVTFAAFGQDEEKTERMIDNTATFVSTGIAKGTFLAFGGNSSLAADVVMSGFANVQEGKLAEVTVLFVGTPEDGERARAAIEPWGANYVFHSIR
jgi:GTPase